jgi:hypothetical protein
MISPSRLDFDERLERSGLRRIRVVQRTKVTQPHRKDSLRLRSVAEDDRRVSQNLRENLLHSAAGLQKVDPPTLKESLLGRCYLRRASSVHSISA